jgi:hypothetical protein
MEWIDLAEDRDQWGVPVNTEMNFLAKSNVGKFLSSCTTGGFSRRVQLHEVSYQLFKQFIISFTSTRFDHVDRHKVVSK